jgi:NAD(P)-dependent dehydrogenase (short-subunit alcohol dehydrogenase family)
MRLENKIALISGSSRGLGLALARAFAREGAAVVLNGRDAAALDAAAQAVRDVAPDAPLAAVAADASTAEGVEQIVENAIRTFGRIDILINNAGTLGPAPRRSLLEHTADDLLETVRINTVGPFLLTKAVLPAMLERSDGSIINVISEAGLTGYAELGAYGVSKAGLELLTQIWAAEIAGSAVRINSVNPGEMDTAMHFAAYPDEDPAQFAAPDDVVEVFVHLASPEARAIHGQRLDAQPDEAEETS